MLGRIDQVCRAVSFIKWAGYRDEGGGRSSVTPTPCPGSGKGWTCSRAPLLLLLFTGNQGRDPQGWDPRDPQGWNQRNPQGWNSRDPQGWNPRDPQGRDPRIPGIQEPQPSAKTLPSPSLQKTGLQQRGINVLSVTSLLLEPFSVSDVKPHFACRGSQRGAGEGWELRGSPCPSPPQQPLGICWGAERAPNQWHSPCPLPKPQPPPSSLCLFAAALSPGSRLMSPAGKRHTSIVIPA